MSAPGEGNGASRPASERGLVSPFLDPELFTHEAEPERAPVRALRIETPFLFALEGAAEPDELLAEERWAGLDGFLPAGADDPETERLEPEETLELEGVEDTMELEDPLDLDDLRDGSEDPEHLHEHAEAASEDVEGEEESFLSEAADGWDAESDAELGEEEEEYGDDEEASYAEALLHEVEDDIGEAEGEAGWALQEWEQGPTMPAGQEVVAKFSLLRRHRGIGPDLVLFWNEIRGRPQSVDVVVHLHGYSLTVGKKLHLVRDLAHTSGIDWSDPEKKDPLPGRTLPTLALLPRGDFFGGETLRGYGHPALTVRGGLQQLIDFGLTRFAAQIGVPSLRMDRLIVTAHSGGVAPLLRILRYADPHEVHVFDGTYQDMAELAKWARSHIERDARALAGGDRPESYMPARGGGLRVLYRPGTRTERHALGLHEALQKALPAGSVLHRWYRVEQTGERHEKIPRRFGWRLLADVAADLPEASPPPPPRPRKRKEVHPGREEYAFDEEARWELEAEAPTAITFPSGVSLPVLTGLPEAKGEDYWDPTGSGNPLLDTGPAQKDRSLSTHFTVRELSSSGGVSSDVSRIDPRFVEALQKLRDHVGKDVKITSGYRSWKRNKQVYAGRKNPDGTPKKPTLSQHCGGRAADIQIKGMSGREIARAAIEACGPNLGIGLGNTFAHVDLRGVATVWNYGGVKDAWVQEIRRYQKERGGSTKAPAKPAAGKPASAKPAAERVRFAQRVLNAAEGERLAEDGDPGPRTRAALERFRQKYGLGGGGELDARTELALVQRGLEEIAQQSMFAQAGVRDANTDAVVADFRARRGLSPGAAVDAALRLAIFDALSPRAAGGRAPAPPSRPSGAGAAGAVKIDERAVAAVERYRPLARAASAKHGVDPALILGVIAAESGGRSDLVARSGYTGLMQAGKGEAHKQPATSIDQGAKKLREFRSIMVGVLKERGRRYESLPEAEQLRLLALAYNAGPVTVAKALQYAAEAGDPARWLDAEHYRRALLFTGAYSLKQAAPSCAGLVPPGEQPARMAEAVQAWNRWRLGTKKDPWRKLPDPPAWAAVAHALPPLLVCAIDFKHRNSPRYAAKILAYRDRFRKAPAGSPAP